MNPTKKCNKTVLAGEGGWRATHCRDCRVAEVEVGAVSLRLGEDAFRDFARLVAAVADRLAAAVGPDAALVAPGARHVH